MNRSIACFVAACLVLVGCTKTTAGHGTHGLPHYPSAAAVMRGLASGDKTITVGGMAKESDQGALPGMGGVAYRIPLTWKNTTYPVGVNMFDSHADLTQWNKLSQNLGGVAVVGDNWAISLPTYDPQTMMTDNWPAKSMKLAPVLAKDLGAAVSK